MYDCYLDGVLLPIAPERVSLKIQNQNQTVTLISEGEINLLKDAGLTDVEFEFLIPAVQYSFAKYTGSFLPPKDFLRKLETLKTNKKPFQFIITRTLPNGISLFNTDLTVSLESYEIEECAENGFDVEVSVKLKQYRTYGTKTIKVVESQKIIATEPQRATTDSPKPKEETTYTVVSGDCLWSIAEHFYNDGSKYALIYSANQELIDNANLGKRVEKYTIYPNQIFTIPGV